MLVLVFPFVVGGYFDANAYILGRRVWWQWWSVGLSIDMLPVSPVVLVMSEDEDLFAVVVLLELSF